MTLPEEFIKYTRELMGDDRFESLATGLKDEAPVSIRLNPLKCDIAHTAITGKRSDVAWCPTGVYLNERPNFTFDPLLHAGAYYVQEASSMFVAHVLRQTVSDSVRMLDLCAAPGGKSTACRTFLPEGSLLISNEPMRTRANILSENMQKFGHTDVIVTNNYPRDFRKSGLMFDVILADVPCSGEGMFRKDEGAISEWSVQNVENCRRLQREIVSDIWPCLKPGGLMIYSTCTFNAHEDEENAAWIAEELGADFVEITVSPEWNITGPLVGDNPSYRFLPGTSEGEGLFMTVLRKHGQYDSPAKAPANKKQNRKTDKAVSLPLTDSDDFETRERGDRLVAIPKKWADVYDAAAKSLNVIHAGITTGTRKGKDIVPDQSLALSARLDRSKFVNVDIDYTQAINFLRKEAVALPDGTPKGFVLLTYKGLPLGFEKNIGNRANNLYPQEWKIKSAHIPEQNEIITEIK